MNDMQFWYPAATSPDEYNNDGIIKQCTGLIRIIKLDREPYEIEITVNGYDFHAIFGTQKKGNYLCVPNWELGCELVSYKDRRWNINSIYHTGKIDYEYACAIGNALDLLAVFLK